MSRRRTQQREKENVHTSAQPSPRAAANEHDKRYRGSHVKTSQLMERLEVRDSARRGAHSESDLDDDDDTQPMSPYTSWLPRYNDPTADNEELVDLPDRLTTKPGASEHIRDLHRCSVQIGTHLRQEREAPAAAGERAKGGGGSSSRAQGELYIKSRLLFRTWRRRYASIVDHSYFGPVLFLFKYDADGNIEVKHSDMIALAESLTCNARTRKTGDAAARHCFCLRTAKKRYMFACANEGAQIYWMDNL